MRDSGDDSPPRACTRSRSTRAGSAAASTRSTPISGAAARRPRRTGPPTRTRCFATSAGGRESTPAGIAAIGASCGVDQAVHLAGRWPAVRGLVALSGSLQPAADSAFTAMRRLPAFIAFADEDGYNTPASMRAMYATARDQRSRLINYRGALHGTPLLAADPALEPAVTAWLGITPRRCRSRRNAGRHRGLRRRDRRHRERPGPDQRRRARPRDPVGARLSPRWPRAAGGADGGPPEPARPRRRGR